MNQAGTRRQALTIEAVGPVDGKLIAATVDQRKLFACRDRSIGQLKEAAFIVPKILKKPTAIFQGLKRDDDEPRTASDEGWLCYCGTPEMAYNQDGDEIAAHKGEVFLVFVSSELVVYNWYWYRCDRDNPDLPEDYGERFDRRAL